MRAVVYEKYGGSDVLTVRTEFPKPDRRPGEVLIENYATSVNPVDIKTRNGMVPPLTGKLPKIPGGDVAGVVVESDVDSRFQPGMRCFALSDGYNFAYSTGSFAEYVSVPEEYLAPAPSSIPLQEAASMPLVGCTAMQALDSCTNLKEGSTVLIHGGAGGVGSIAVQIAKARGFRVISTASARNIEFVKSLGADQVIDYTQTRFEDACKHQVDAIIDMVGCGYEERGLTVLKSTGTYVNVFRGIYGASGAACFLCNVARRKLNYYLGRGPRYVVLLVRPNGRQLEELAALVDDAKVQSVIDRMVPLARTREAHECVEQHLHSRGKVVVTIKE